MTDADALSWLPESDVDALAMAPTISTIAPLLANFTGLAEDQREEQEGIMNRPSIKGFFLVMYVIVFVSCLLGNSMILIVIIANRSMRTLTNYFLANLAVADLLVGVFCVCQNGVHFVLFEHGLWPFGRVLCHTYIYILHMIPNASAGILVLLSIERFIAVLRPMLVHHLMTRSVLVLCAMLVWAFSALMNLPYLFAVQFLEMTDPATGVRHGICTRRFLLWHEINILQVVSSNLILWYVVPLTTLLCIYITIGFVLMKTTEDDSFLHADSIAHSSQSAAQNPHRMLNATPSSASAYASHRRESEATPKIEVVDSRRRVIRLCVVIVLAFAILSLPRYLYLTWSVWRDRNAPRCVDCLAALIQPATFILMFINSAINPVLYAFLSQRFRSAIHETFTCAGRRRRQRQNQVLISLRKRRRLSEQPEQPLFNNGTPANLETTKMGNHLGENDSLMQSTID